MGSRQRPDMSHNPEEALFAAALERPPSERAAFLDGACLGDSDLRSRVDALLSSYDATSNPLATVQATFQDSESPVFPPPFEESVGQTLGRYKLLEKLGEGGCGVVYVAEQTQPVRRRVALKIIKLGMDTKSVVARFEAERQALALMDHPNIAKVLDAGTTELGRPFFVMELVRGIRITDYCDQNQLSTQQRLQLFIKVCQAVQHAHQKGIIHRDIKPSNILVTLHDGEPVPKVIDFGIAKATEGRLTDATIYTQLHQFIGTPAYMSPEQAEMSGLDIDTRSDIYSLGVLLYEILTGRPPFDPKELMAQGIDGIRRTIREKEPARPSTRLATLSGEELTTTAQRRSTDSAKLSPLVRGDLDWIVMKCLEKDRARRYETANGLAADLRRHLENEPVVARPPSAGYRLHKAWKRNRLVYSAGALVIVALSIALVQALVFGSRTNAALQRAEAARAAEEAQRKIAQTAQSQSEQQRQRAEENQLDSRRRAYAAAMVLAQQALANNDLSRARALLDDQRPTAGEQDLRGWEWRYLWGLTRPDEHTVLVRQPEALSAVAVSPLGNRIAYANMDMSVEVFNLSTRAVELRAKGGGYFGTTPRPIAFSPVEPWFAFHETLDGGRHVVTVWDFEQRTNRCQITAGRWVMGLHFSSDGHVLAILDPERGLRLFNPATGISRLEWPGTTNAPTFAMSADSKLLIAANIDESIHVLSGVNSGITHRIIRGTGRMPSSVAVSRDNHVIASGEFGVETRISIWDIETGELIRRLDGHRAYTHQLAFSPDNQWLASASADQTIRLWDWRTGDCAAVFRGHLGEVWSVAFSADGTLLYTASKDGTVRSWPIANKIVRRSQPWIPGVQSFAGFLEDNRTMVTVSTNSTVDFWDGTGLSPTRHFSSPWTNAVSGQVSPDKTRILVGFDDGMIREWNLADRRLCAESRGGTNPLIGVRYRFGGAGWLANSWDYLRGGQVYVWGTDPQRVPELLPTTGARMESFPKSDLVAIRTGKSFSVWDPKTLQRKQILQFGRSADFLAVSSDGTLLAETSFDPIGMAMISTWPDLRIQGEFRQHLLGAHGVCFSPDNQRLATGSTGRESVRIWDVATQMELLTLETEHSQFERVEFSSDGNRLAAKSYFNELHVWTAPTWNEIESEAAQERGQAKSPEPSKNRHRDGK